MKKDLIYIGIILLLSFFLYKEYKKPVETIEVPVRVEVKVPVIEKEYDTIYEPSPIKEIIDSTYYDLYISLLDSVKKDSLVKDILTVREYNQVFDDSVQTIDVYSEVLGRLKKQNLSYKTKPKTIVVDTIIPVDVPFRNTFGAGLEFGKNKTENIFKANIEYDMKKLKVNLGADTKGTLWFGLTHKFKNGKNKR